MSTHAETPDAPAAKRIKPHHLALGLGVGIAVFTAISGIVPLITGWHNENAIHREVFGNIPGPLKVAFYTVIPVLLVWGAFQFSNRMKNWERGAPAQRRTTAKNAKRRAADFRAGVYMQTLLRDSAAGLMHSMIYFGFLVLMGVTTILEIDHQMPEDLKFLQGRTYQAYAFVGDAAGLVFTVGIIWAIVRRYVQKPYRIRIKSKPEHAVILGTFLVIGISGFEAEMFRIALGTASGEDMSWEKYSFIGYPLSKTVDGLSVGTLETWHQWAWVAHVVAFVVFLAILPVTMLRHMFTSPLNMYLRDKDRPKGAMKPMPNLMETELESFGASVVEDFTWKQLLDTDACTMCGRCTSVCPAHATGKPLDPREIVLKTGEVMAATGNPSGQPTARHRSGDHDRRQQLVRADHPRRDLGLHELQGLRRDLPGQHRDPRQDPRHAALPVVDGVELPRRAGQRLPGDGEPGQPVGHEPGRARRLGERPGGRAGRRPGRAVPGRVPVLGGLRRFVRRQEQEGHPGDGQAADTGRHRRRDPRPERDVHRRLGAPLGQRVPVPDAGHAEHRDARRRWASRRSSPSARTASTH